MISDRTNQCEEQLWLYASAARSDGVRQPSKPRSLMSSIPPDFCEACTGATESGGPCCVRTMRAKQKNRTGVAKCGESHRPRLMVLNTFDFAR